MTYEKAALILDPATSRDALWKYEEDADRLAACDKACRIGAAAIRAQQERENPKPLTLDELREMDGEPVWIAPAKKTGKIPQRWMLYAGVQKDAGVYIFAPASGIAQGYAGGDYGKIWLAYRHKPEEGGTYDTD